MSTATTTLSSEEMFSYRKAYNLCFDRDKDGTMTTQELGNVLRNLGQNPTEAELQELVLQLDKDKNGTLEFEELLAVITENIVEPVDEIIELKEIFNAIDKDKNGLIGYNDLKSIVSNSGLDISEKDVERMIDEADSDNDKQISFDDFCEILKPTLQSSAASPESAAEMAASLVSSQ